VLYFHRIIVRSMLRQLLKLRTRRKENRYI
jgi:hypothetical protein